MVSRPLRSVQMDSCLSVEVWMIQFDYGTHIPVNIRLPSRHTRVMSLLLRFLPMGKHSRVRAVTKPFGYGILPLKRSRQLSLDIPVGVLLLRFRQMGKPLPVQRMTR